MTVPTLAIQVRGATLTYPGGEQPALDGVDLAVGEGRICALLGANGAGKTTLIRILTTLLAPDGGLVEVAGLDVRRDGHEVRRRIGMVGQDAALDAVLSARRNLMLFAALHGLPRAERQSRAEGLLADLGIEEVADRPVSTLSGGQRRRLDLAVGVLTRPRVLFLDEPTTGLDPQGRRDLWERVRRLAASGVTVLLTTQQLEEADALADDVVILRDGRVVATGTPDELTALVGEPRMELRRPTLEDVYLHLHADTTAGGAR